VRSKAFKLAAWIADEAFRERDVKRPTELAAAGPNGSRTIVPVITNAYGFIPVMLEFAESEG
jgi:hypothetical protein